MEFRRVLFRSRTRLGFDLKDVARAESALRGKRVGLNLHISRSFNRGNVDHSAPGAVRIPDAVQHISRGSEKTAAKVQEGDILIGFARGSAFAQCLILGGVLYG